MVIKANLRTNSGLLEASLTPRTVKIAVLAGLDYPEFRLFTARRYLFRNLRLRHSFTTEWRHNAWMPK